MYIKLTGEELILPKITTKLLCTLENAMYMAMQEKQYSAVASNLKVLMQLVGLAAVKLERVLWEH